MNEIISALSNEFLQNSNTNIAVGQAAYMKNNFDFFGIKTPLRRQIQKPFLQVAYLPPKNEAFEMAKILWQKNEREYQYFAQELVYKYIKTLEKDDIVLFEYLITHKSWWDTVDFIAPNLVGNYFKAFPEQRRFYIDQWLASGNIWLQRSALLFQLKYKDTLDTECLTHIIKSLLGSHEFFINKAIGWILRQYSRTHPAWVINFANNHPLSKLSYSEALRLL